ncbi:EAL domain-containing protein [Hoeflea sp.]|uniref:EAL domain-containing protein n=1 Tax=Hoeflea sp. TaxID=1940281 RepID=UPI0037490A22
MSSIGVIIGPSVVPFSMALLVVSIELALLLMLAFGVSQTKLCRQLVREREIAASLRQAANHDSLTGLRNRRALGEDVANLLADKKRPGMRLALLLFDLDRFKSINDTLGHGVGDTVLKTLGLRIGVACTSAQRAYRLGGDEFLVLWENAPCDADISAFCQGLEATVFRPVDCAEGALETAGSIGISCAKQAEFALSDMLKRADLALYRAKETPGVSHAFFSAEMDSDYRLRRELEADMRLGLTSGAFSIEYLPVYEVQSMQPTGFSAQLKWVHPVHGVVAPTKFMPVAEECGLVVMIGKWMLAEALLAAQSWGHSSEIIVPVSLAQLSDPGFSCLVATLLKDTGVAAQRLVLDVRAAAVPAGDLVAMAAIARLRGAGVRIAVSDFSAGIAGLAMSRPHPVDRVRLDLGHIKAIAGEQRFAQMLSLFVQLANTVDKPVMLTGVDGAADVESAIAAGVPEIEGRFVCSALSAGQVSMIFHSRKPTAALVRLAS